MWQKDEFLHHVCPSYFITKKCHKKCICILILFKDIVFIFVYRIILSMRSRKCWLFVWRQTEAAFSISKFICVSNIIHCTEFTQGYQIRMSGFCKMIAMLPKQYLLHPMGREKAACIGRCRVVCVSVFNSCRATGPFLRDNIGNTDICLHVCTWSCQWEPDPVAGLATLGSKLATIQ